MMAAAISYFVLFAIVPLVTCLVALIGFVLRNPEVERRVVDQILNAVPLDAFAGQNMVLDAIRSVTHISGTLTLVGLAGLLWTSAGLFGTVRDALNIVWDAVPRRRWLVHKLLDVVGILGLGLLLLASIAGSALLHSLHGRLGVLPPVLDRLIRWGGWLPALVSFVFFLLLYRFVPTVRHGFRDVWPGALVAAASFELSKHGFTLYVANFGRYQMVYGALGAVMLFMLWTYVSALILLIGAEVASAWERMRRERAAAILPPLEPGGP
jgi:membrane protein